MYENRWISKALCWVKEAKHKNYISFIQHSRKGKKTVIKSKVVHMPWGNQAPVSQLLKPAHPRGHALHQKQPHTATRESSCSSPSKGDPAPPKMHTFIKLKSVIKSEWILYVYILPRLSKLNMCVCVCVCIRQCYLKKRWGRGSWVLVGEKREAKRK